jgi:hypothetical protein
MSVAPTPNRSWSSVFEPIDQLEDLHPSVRISKQLHRKVEGIELIRPQTGAKNSEPLFQFSAVRSMWTPRPPFAGRSTPL